MCFTSSDRTDDPPPRPAQVPQQQQQQQPSKASMPQDYAPPSGPPPPRRSQGDDYAAPSGPPPSHRRSDDNYAPPSGPPPSQHNYAPPTGPPPSHRARDDYAPPSGPPPSQQYAPPSGPPPSKKNPFYDDFAPPSGPPPSHQYGGGQGSSSDYAPPPGPPPSQDYAAPPGPPPQQGSDMKKKHDWETAVPDTALLPPPPSFFSGFDRSPANNATEEEAEGGERWCRDFPLAAPLQPQPGSPELNAMHSGNINMFSPPFFRGTLQRTAVGVWRGQSQPGATDTCLATYPPLYSAAAHSPIATGRRKTIYYEVHILSEGSGHEVSLAMGFAAPPYPPFRLPGWHRGSLAVHGDDGHKYINDRWGGKAFTHPFRRGETLGLGMELIPGRGGGIEVEIFLTRDGHESGRWNLHEETDQQQDLPVTGLEGFHDLCAAVGVFEKVGFEIVFVPEKWRWQGWRGQQY
ncbi:hypothetical protein F4808DRAFT_431357 [Astrocystis sublimbata]|nr:hypothetical protein F4808DRAFT_431357 [Astrocystis sublimbata]